MADELDSGSSVGYHVWVQVPSSALYIRKGLRVLPEAFSYIQIEACRVVLPEAFSYIQIEACRVSRDSMFNIKRIPKANTFNTHEFFKYVVTIHFYLKNISWGFPRIFNRFNFSIFPGKNLIFQGLFFILYLYRRIIFFGNARKKRRSL